MNNLKNRPAPSKNEQLVYVENNIPITNSRLIAKTFGKQHRHVLRDIQTIGCSDEFTQSNFGLSVYKDKSGKENKEFHITKDGFSMLAFGYTGVKAMKFKEDYIKRFNQMELKLKDDELKQQKAIESDVKIVENVVYPVRLGTKTTDCYFTNGQIYTRFNLLLGYLNNSSISKIMREKIGEEKFIFIKVNKTDMYFGNFTAYKRFLAITKNKPDYNKINDAAKSIWGKSAVVDMGPKEDYTYRFTDREMLMIFTEIDHKPINKDAVRDLLHKGRNMGGAL